eukprot:COSAG06_NODE_12179_length_1410_cov_2.055598_3_plen_52_part_01
MLKPEPKPEPEPGPDPEPEPEPEAEPVLERTAWVRRLATAAAAQPSATPPTE